MRKQVGHAENGVARVLANVDVHNRAVLLGNHAMQGQRRGNPLIRLDAAVVVRVQKGQLVGLVNGILLNVQARAIDVRAQDVKTGLQRLGAQLQKDDRLAVNVGPHLVAGLELGARSHQLGQGFVARFLRQLDALGRGAALGFAFAQEIDVAGVNGFKLGKLLFVQFLPRVGAFHIVSFLMVGFAENYL